VTRLILASQSPARTKLLKEAGVNHEIMVSDVDEDAVQAHYGVTDAHDTALLLARAKAEAVASLPEAEGALVIGCDSVFEFDGESHGKPYTSDVARERMLRMSGSMGVLHTGHWLVDCRETAADHPDAEGTGATIGAVSSAEVHFVEMSAEDIEDYIATGEPLHCAGSFTIDGMGGAFIRKVDGDPHAVVGLSISTLRELLRHANVSITELWSVDGLDGSA
jgi:septum formation protein